MTLVGSAAVSVAAAIGGIAYFSLGSQAQVLTKMKLEQITEEVFDHRDNLFVFFFDTSEELTERQDEVQRVCRALVRETSLHRLTYYFNVRKEGDPPQLPDVAGGAGTGRPLRCVMYKGQRKSQIKIEADLPLSDIIAFFAARAEQEQESWKKLPVKRLTGQNFHAEVCEASTPGAPVVLQMYEDTCFLCFLMRPFINSLAKLLRENKVPLTFKRLNIAENDFPDKCPVARGTPTFMCFRGNKSPPTKWEEFKPKDLVERLAKEYTNLPESFYDEMDELQGLVSKRFQLVTQLIMWTVELQKLETLVTAAGIEGAPAPSKSEAPADPEVNDDAFGVLVSKFMAKDMRRTDLLRDNIQHLMSEVDDVEHDAVLLGIMLAESVQRREEQEAQSERKQGRFWR